MKLKLVAPTAPDHVTVNPVLLIKLLTRFVGAFGAGGFVVINVGRDDAVPEGLVPMTMTE